MEVEKKSLIMRGLLMRFFSLSIAQYVCFRYVVRFAGFIGHFKLLFLLLLLYSKIHSQSINALWQNVGELVQLHVH